ncbi:MBL fold metallo-hydrolase [Endozoicomonas arenosclerae]|uniref:MBL fold metallo-hydrolase n=1 Tax=Endozoicomonas arenosclerae TaxID=1633495 RepID=UPI00078099D0|nr:MBL fold metallo-hydrolase [Endozoicomonas arenosclerae]
MAVFERFEYQGVDAIRTGRQNHISGSFVNYRVGDTLIDCGPVNQWKWLKPFFEEKAIRQVLITHYHEDHSGNSLNFNQSFNIIPKAHEITVEQLQNGFSIPLAGRIFWGSVPRATAQPLPEQTELENGETVIPIHVPGHCPDMHCYFIPDRGWMFTGDLYIAKVIKFMHRKESLPQQVEDIRAVLACDFDTIFCPHRGVVGQGKQAMQDKLDYLLELSSKAQSLHHQGKTLREITQILLGAEELASYVTRFAFSKRSLIEGCLEVEL